MDISVWEVDRSSTNPHNVGYLPPGFSISYDDIAVIDHLFDPKHNLSLEKSIEKPSGIFPRAFTVGWNEFQEGLTMKEFQKWYDGMIIHSHGQLLKHLEELRSSLESSRIQEIFRTGERSITFGELVQEAIPNDEHTDITKLQHRFTHTISGWHGMSGGMIVVLQHGPNGVKPRIVGLFVGGVEKRNANVAVHITSAVKLELDKVFRPQQSANPQPLAYPEPSVVLHLSANSQSSEYVDTMELYEG
ncbi:hypothetical protein MMC13_008182 [Lambiella insularis]|nr:hypothetical protein [Lambiella insularis]